MSPGNSTALKVGKWPTKINENLPPAEIIALEEILDEFRNVFAFDASELGIIEGETYHIKLTDEMPIFKQQYRLSQSEKEILQEQMEERKNASPVIHQGDAFEEMHPPVESRRSHCHGVSVIHQGDAFPQIWLGPPQCPEQSFVNGRCKRKLATRRCPTNFIITLGALLRGSAQNNALWRLDFHFITTRHIYSCQGSGRLDGPVSEDVLCARRLPALPRREFWCCTRTPGRIDRPASRPAASGSAVGSRRSTRTQRRSRAAPSALQRGRNCKTFSLP
jgi:hypothetical protein